MAEEMQNIVKIQSALSNKPIFVRIDNVAMSVDHIFTEAISTLRNTGRPLEAEQLANLVKSHSVFSDGKLIQKGDFFRDLPKKTQAVGNQSVNLLELDLVTSHSGGSHDIANHKGTPQCAACRTKKVFWRIRITDPIRPNFENVMYACGPCVEKLENRILKKRPFASVRREKVTMLDFQEYAEGRQNYKTVAEGKK